MFISYQELVVMTICAGITAFMTVLLLVANYQLLRENRFLRGRLRAWRSNCAKHHSERPF